MKLKVCGMRDKENMNRLVELEPDFIGFIFYAKSPRYVGADLDTTSVPSGIAKVGVFVNEAVFDMLEAVKKHDLDYVQLHGGESLAVAQELNKSGVKVIKVFSVSDQMPVADISTFEAVANLFLFDTKTPAYGGSGSKFDWNILKEYHADVPFLLSGGISTHDVEEIQNLKIKQLIGIDVNSRFEMEPGLKDIDKIKELKELL